MNARAARGPYSYRGFRLGHASSRDVFIAITLMPPILFIIAVLLGIVAPYAYGASAEQELKRFVDEVKTFEAAFTQVQTDEAGELLSTQSGRFWLSRPGSFRWAYEKPYEQLMVCDGKRIWMHDPDLRQVTVRPAGEALAGTPAELLSQNMTLTSAFTLEDRGTEDGARALRLVPKAADADFKSIDLWLRAGAPQRLRFADQLGGVTEVQFRNTKVNSKLDPALFRFTPPKGTEVIEAPQAQ